MKLLFATDGSEYSDIAAKFLTRFDWSPQDAVTIFHAVYALPFPEDRKFHFETLTALKKDLAPKILDSAAALLKPLKAAVSVEIREFSPNECTPDECIRKTAESSGADMIVMGARGIKGVKSAFLGSVTRLVTLHAKSPVLVVKPSAKSAADRMKVLFAVDGTDHSHAAAKFLATVPFPESTDVTVLHVSASGFSDIPERFALEVDDRIKETVAAARERDLAESERIVEGTRKLLAGRFRAIAVLSKIGDPSAEIVHTAEAEGSDLVVVGCRGLHGIKGLLGSVSRNVLTHASCSVLIGRTC